MNKLNLLPHHIRQYKKARRQKIFLVGLQFTIFLCIGVAFLAINIEERTLASRSQSLISDLVGFDDHQLLLAEELDATIAFMQNFDDFYAANFPISFETLWFEVITQDATISRLYYRQAEILIQGYVTNILDVEDYRQTLLDAGIFENIRSGMVQLQNCGRFSFVLYAQVCSNE